MPYRKGHTRTVKSKKSCIGRITVKVKSTMTKQAKRPRKRK
jgi:hypothetical protein